MGGMANPIDPIPLSGHQHHISAGDYAATVTQLGAGLRQLSYQGDPVLAGYPAAGLPPAGAGALLVPWPNRIDGGRYAFGGQNYQLDLSEPAHGNAIHGLTRWTGWDITDHPAESVTLRHLLLGRPGYPFCLELTAVYQLDQVRGLQVSITARNAGSQPAPYGTGQHPYLTAGTPDIDGCTLEIAASHWLPTDDRGIPSGPVREVTGTPYDFTSPRPLAGVSLDHALTGLARDPDGRVRAVLRPAAGSPGPDAGAGQAAGRSSCGLGRATTGCRYSPGTRCRPTGAGGRSPSSR